MLFLARYFGSCQKPYPSVEPLNFKVFYDYSFSQSLFLFDYFWDFNWVGSSLKTNISLNLGKLPPSKEDLCPNFSLLPFQKIYDINLKEN